MDLLALKTVARRGAIVLSSCLLLACNKQEADLPYYNTPDLTPVWEQGSGIHAIAPFSLVDQDSNSITNNTFEGKIYVVNFFFVSCPGICPKMTSNLQKVAAEFKGDDRVALLSHSVTPAIDSVAILKEYAANNSIDSKQWHLVTGSQSEIYLLARRSYFAEDEIGFNYDSTDFLHTERVVLVDRDGHMRGVYNGTVALEMQRLTDDIHILLKEE